MGFAFLSLLVPFLNLLLEPQGLDEYPGVLLFMHKHKPNLVMWIRQQGSVTLQGYLI